jgi:arginine decarboxylase-like protein
MGDMHNLFGRVHEAEVILDPRGKPVLHSVWGGEPARDTLSTFGYEEGELVTSITSGLRERVGRGEISQQDADELLEDFRRRLTQYTYLD